jgi:hypothetical protein
LASPAPRLARADLRADCTRCAGLCCVAPTFVRSADFAISKPAGTPCPNLQDDYGCSIHASLSNRGFRGCAVFDCFGAGQHLVQQTFGGRTWRTDPDLAPTMFTAFDVVRALSEMLWHLAEAAEMPTAAPESERIDALRELIEGLTNLSADDIIAVDVAAHRRTVGVLLDDVSRGARAHLGRDTFDGRHADLVGADLRRTDLRGAALRGALLLGADLRGNDLRAADLLGADVRGADLRGTDLSNSLFLTQPQLNAARGDGSTRIPAVLARPTQWRAGSAAS